MEYGSDFLHRCVRAATQKWASQFSIVIVVLGSPPKAVETVDTTLLILHALPLKTKELHKAHNS